MTWRGGRLLRRGLAARPPRDDEPVHAPRRAALGPARRRRARRERSWPWPGLRPVVETRGLLGHAGRSERPPVIGGSRRRGDRGRRAGRRGDGRRTWRWPGREVVLSRAAPQWRWRACGVFSAPAAVEALRRLGLDEATLERVARPIPAMRVETPGGARFRLAYGSDGTLRAPAVGFDRSALDPALLAIARGRGADVREGHDRPIRPPGRRARARPRRGRRTGGAASPGALRRRGRRAPFPRRSGGRGRPAGPARRADRARVPRAGPDGRRP